MFAFEAIYKEIPTSFALPMFCFASLLLGTTVHSKNVKIVNCSEVVIVLTLQKQEVYSQLNIPVKRFKICHIFGIQKPM